MKRHKIFNKGQYIFCLLSSRSKPDILIPVRAFIVDTEWDPVNPKYKIKILKFYDTYTFLKKHFFDTVFLREFDKKGRRRDWSALKPEDFNNRNELIERLHGPDEERFYVVVDSIMCVQHKEELSRLFNRIQMYLISKRFKEIRETSMRPFYTGPFSTDSAAEWDTRFRQTWGDMLEARDVDVDTYLSSIK